MRRKALIPLIGAVALVLTACGGGGDSGGGGEETAATIPTGSPSGPTIAVAVGATDQFHMYMNLSQSSIAAGTVTFVITNEDVKEHEVVVMKTDTMVADLPVSDNEAVESGVVDELEDIPAGATQNLTVTLEPGHYALICNIPGHFEKGMRADFEVT